jgi:hypothetical protein
MRANELYYRKANPPINVPRGVISVPENMLSICSPGFLGDRVSCGHNFYSNAD